jgi:hypothetical protein
MSRNSLYKLNIITESEVVLSIKHTKYNQFNFTVTPGQEYYSFTSNAGLVLHTFKITSTGDVIIKNLQVIHESEDCGSTIYQIALNGISVNPLIEKCRAESKNQTQCNLELSAIPFTPVALKSGDLLVIRYSIEWRNFKTFNENFKDKLSKATISR